ncbi:MAG: pirin family protein [Bermanella sp.]
MKTKTIRKVIHRQGNNPAYITNDNLKDFAPFALFDAGRVPSHDPLIIGWHPHSGVATITFPYDADLHHKDSAGNHGIIRDQGLQWMAAGKGVWHQESYFPLDNGKKQPQKKIGIMQLWLMLDPEEEINTVNYFNLQPEHIPMVKENFSITRVLLGEYQGTKAAKEIKHNATYLDVNLKAGDHWNFKVPAKQIRGFVYPRIGSIEIANGRIDSQELALLNEDSYELKITALQDSQFVVALTEPWPHKIIQHYGQIHTNEAALKIGNAHIQKSKQALIKMLAKENNGAHA